MWLGCVYKTISLARQINCVFLMFHYVTHTVVTQMCELSELTTQAVQIEEYCP